MVNLGLSKVSDAVAAKHPVSVSRPPIVEMCWSVEDTQSDGGVMSWETEIKQNESFNENCFFSSGFGGLRCLSVSCLHEGNWDLYIWYVMLNVYVKRLNTFIAIAELADFYDTLDYFTM